MHKPTRLHHAAVLPFTDAGVRTLINLAPLLGRRNPASVKTVINVMRNLIGTDGPRLERAPPIRRRAVKAQARRAAA
jgi:hypothetical protein